MATKTARRRVLSADLYDTIELVAMVNGGIGRSEWFAEDLNGELQPNCPVCVNGLAVVAGIHLEEGVPEADDVEMPCFAVGIRTSENDHAVKSLIKEGRYIVDGEGKERVTFADFCERLNIVRGS